MPDVIEFEILEDGTVSAETEKVSAANHFAADDLLNGIEDMLGGERKITQKDKAKTHHITIKTTYTKSRNGPRLNGVHITKEGK